VQHAFTEPWKSEQEVGSVLGMLLQGLFTQVAAAGRSQVQQAGRSRTTIVHVRLRCVDACSWMLQPHMRLKMHFKPC
jgi:hypothetical protein